MAYSKKRGIKALLSDTSNIPEVASKRTCAAVRAPKRKCAAIAKESIQKQTRKAAPRGRHVQKLATSTALPDTTLEPENPTLEPENPTLHQVSLSNMLKSRPEILHHGKDIISKYIERNITFTEQKAMALNIFAVAVSEGDGVLDACKMAAKFTGFNPEVIRRWAMDIFLDFFGSTSNIDDIDDEAMEAELMSSRGKHSKCDSLMHDENFTTAATAYVREHGYVKGAPNLTLSDFTSWVLERWEVEICDETARVWLHQMGFSYRQFSKGVYFDGHEREDVVEHRKKYLATTASLEHRMITSPSQLPHDPSILASNPIIRVFHDESTFHANADQTFHWSDGSNQALKQKSLGQAVMVSDFIDEVNGYLEFEGEEARLYLEHQSEGYFTNDMFVDQVSGAIDIFEAKYPGTIGMFMFDNAPSHCKKPDDCLNPDKMNVSDGGKQPFVRDTMWNGHTQKMTHDGVQKGMRRVLEERGVNTHKMKADAMRAELKKFEDFKCDGVPIVEEMITGRGHMCFFIPRFHCELNPIERCWCHAKRFTRAYSNGSIVRLRTIVPKGLATVSSALMSSFFLTCKDFERAYREGHTCNSVDKVVKQYKSHRRVYVGVTAGEDGST